jgi:hypothetical protein
METLAEGVASSILGVKGPRHEYEITKTQLVKWIYEITARIHRVHVYVPSVASLVNKSSEEAGEERRVEMTDKKSIRTLVDDLVFRRQVGSWVRVSGGRRPAPRPRGGESVEEMTATPKVKVEESEESTTEEEQKEVTRSKRPRIEPPRTRTSRTTTIRPKPVPVSRRRSSRTAAAESTERTRAQLERAEVESGED